MSVRKQAIVTLRDILSANPKTEKRGEILANILHRAADETAVRVQCSDLFQTLWFTPSENKQQLAERVRVLVKKLFLCSSGGKPALFR